MLQVIKLKTNTNQVNALYSFSSRRNFSFLDYFSSKKSSKKTATNDNTKNVLDDLKNNESSEGVNINESFNKSLNLKNTKVIGDSSLYEERLHMLKSHRFSQLKVQKWNEIDESEVEKFSKEDILNLIAKYNIKQDEISRPFADYKTKFLFAKDLQKISGRSLSDFNLSLFTSPEEFLQFYQKIYLSGSFDKYDETKPLAIFLKVGDDSANLENEVFLDLKDAGQEYKDLVSTITERTKVFSPKDNNVKIKNTRSLEEQKALKEIIKEEAEYLNLKAL